MEDMIFIASFLVSSSHETFIEENRWCVCGGGLSQNQAEAHNHLRGGLSYAFGGKALFRAN